MNKFEMIASINSKAKNNRNDLQSLNYTLVFDSANSKGEGNVEYSRTGTFVTEMPGHLMQHRIKGTSNPNIFQLYIGNIYPTQFETDRFRSSGLVIHEAQKDREFDFAEDNYSNLTDEEVNLLSEKIEVYTNIDAKMAGFLKTRKSGQKIIISGRYDFTRPEYSIIPPTNSDNAGSPGKRRRRQTTENAVTGNQFWDRIKLNLLTPYFIQPEEVDVRFGKGIKFTDISKSVKLATFKLEAQKLAVKYKTTVKFTNENIQVINFDLNTVPESIDSEKDNVVDFKLKLFSMAKKYNIDLKGDVFNNILQVNYFKPFVKVVNEKEVDNNALFLKELNKLQTSFKIVNTEDLTAIFANGMRYTIKNNFTNLYYTDENIQGLTFDLTNHENKALFKQQIQSIGQVYRTKLYEDEVENTLQIKYLKDKNESKMLNDLKSLSEFQKIEFDQLSEKLQNDNKDKKVSSFEFSYDIALELKDYMKFLKPVKSFNVVIPRNTKDGIIFGLSAQKTRNQFVKKNEYDGKVFYTEYLGKVSIPRQISIDDKFMHWDESISVQGSGPDAVPFKKQTAAQLQAKKESDGTDEKGLADMQPTHISVVRYSFAHDDSKCFYESNGTTRYTINGKKFRIPIFYKF